MNKDELRKFCADSHHYRPLLCEPWTIGKLTYATNGHIIVRIKRLDDVPENKKAPMANKLFDTAKTGDWLLVPETKMPPELKCDVCGGSGVWWAEGKERGECEDCYGTGKKPNQKAITAVGPAHFADRYLALIQGWEIAPSDDRSAAPIMLGEVQGLLMPTRQR